LEALTLDSDEIPAVASRESPANQTKQSNKEGKIEAVDGKNKISGSTKRDKLQSQNLLAVSPGTMSVSVQNTTQKSTNAKQLCCDKYLHAPHKRSLSNAHHRPTNEIPPAVKGNGVGLESIELSPKGRSKRSTRKSMSVSQASNQKPSSIIIISPSRTAGTIGISTQNQRMEDEEKMASPHQTKSSQKGANRRRRTTDIEEFSWQRSPSNKSNDNATKTRDSATLPESCDSNKSQLSPKSPSKPQDTVKNPKESLNKQTVCESRKEPKLKSQKSQRALIHDLAYNPTTQNLIDRSQYKRAYQNEKKLRKIEPFEGSNKIYSYSEPIENKKLLCSDDLTSSTPSLSGSLTPNVDVGDTADKTKALLGSQKVNLISSQDSNEVIRDHDDSERLREYPNKIEKIQPEEKPEQLPRPRPKILARQVSTRRIDVTLPRSLLRKAESERTLSTLESNVRDPSLEYGCSKISRIVVGADEPLTKADTNINRNMKKGSEQYSGAKLQTSLSEGVSAAYRTSIRHCFDYKESESRLLKEDPSKMGSKNESYGPSFENDCEDRPIHVINRNRRTSAGAIAKTMSERNLMSSPRSKYDRNARHMSAQKGPSQLRFAKQTSKRQLEFHSNMNTDVVDTPERSMTRNDEERQKRDQTSRRKSVDEYPSPDGYHARRRKTKSIFEAAVSPTSGLTPEDIDVQTSKSHRAYSRPRIKSEGEFLLVLLSFVTR
jgi:hypothetical protein